MSTRFKHFDNVRNRHGNRGLVTDVSTDSEWVCVQFEGDAVATRTTAAELTLVARADAITNPPHYTQHPSGVECIAIAEHFGFCLGSVVKYVWRAGLKQYDGDDALASALKDLKKAQWFLDREIERRAKESAK